jgi:hypothetical protein
MRIVFKSFPDHKGIPGHQGGSVARGEDSSINTVFSKFSYADYTKSSDKSSFIKNNVNKIFSVLGIKSNVEIVDDKKFSEIFHDIKVSAGATILDVHAGYHAKNNIVYLRQSRLDAVKSKSDYRLYKNVIYHEIGHAYHADILGIKVQDKGEYGSGWCEDFADDFGNWIGYSERLHNVYTGISVPINSRELAKATDYNLQSSFDEMLKRHERTKQFVGRFPCARRCKMKKILRKTTDKTTVTEFVPENEKDVKLLSELVITGKIPIDVAHKRKYKNVVKWNKNEINI